MCNNKSCINFFSFLSAVLEINGKVEHADFETAVLHTGMWILFLTLLFAVAVYESKFI